MDATRLWPLEGVVQPYAWGSTTAIPELLGRAPTGEPQAELWLGAHREGPARVDGTTLDAWIRSDPVAVLGEQVARRFEGELPFLLKVLAAAEPLSIQAHPSEAQARAGFERENAAGLALDAPERCYRDPHHKPELICALTPFRALCRFREPEEIADRIGALGVAGLDPVIAPLRDAPDAEGLAAFFSGWMGVEESLRRALVEEIAGATARASDPASCEVCALFERHPGDPGVLGPLFLNLVELEPGQALFLPAGELHGYLGGTGVELMANSDNVIRGGLTQKHVDVGELIATLTFASGPVEVLRPLPASEGALRYETPAAEFELSWLRPGESSSVAPAVTGVEVLLCTEGTVSVIDGAGHRLDLPRGAAAIVPSAAGGYRVEGSGAVCRARTPLD